MMHDVGVRWSRGVLPPSTVIARSAQKISEYFNSFTYIRWWKIANHDKLKWKDEYIRVYLSDSGDVLEHVLQAPSAFGKRA